MRLNKRDLIDVFSGWMNKTAREIVNVLGNRSPEKHSIALVQRALTERFSENWKSLKGVFELAAISSQISRGTGSVGRRVHLPASTYPWLSALEPRP